MKVIIPDRADWFESDDGFPRPRWRAIYGWMRVYVHEPELENAWQQFAAHWLARLRVALGGNYFETDSEHFYLLSELGPDERAKLLTFLENSRWRIRKVLGDLATSKSYGKHLVTRFTDHDDYYAYIAHFYPDGNFAASGGVFLNHGYWHIAYPQGRSADYDRRTVVHELTHNLLAHLPLPPWVNEALAMAFETDVTGAIYEPLSRELVDRHRAYWNEATIQKFWCGEAFCDVDAQELAYSLSRVLLHLLRTEFPLPEGSFRRFVVSADWSDAGCSAAKDHLELELEDVVSGFLGPGNWMPQPKTWKREQETENTDRLACTF